MSKKFLFPLLAVLLVLSLSLVAFADTIRLKDGSVIRGQVVGFKDQQFIVQVGAGSRGRRSTLLLYMEDVESIEFEGTSGGISSAGAGDDNVTTTRPSTTGAQTSRPVNTSPPPSTQTAAQNSPRQSTTGSSTQTQPARPATQTSSAPAFFQLNARVRGDNTANGWTNTGLVVRRGQRIRLTAMGQVSLGNGRFSTPAGISTLSDPKKLMPNEPTGALIAVVGDDNNDFILVGRTREFTAQRDGVLFLGVNEDNLNDNTGAYDVVIEAEATGSSAAR